MNKNSDGIKENKQAPKSRNNASFFKRHNIIEFKSPKYILNIQAFHRVMGYFHFYLAQNKLKFDDVAITFVSVNAPKKLLNYLENEQKYKIVPAEQSGIYYITSESVQSPKMQLVISSQLSAKDAEWLRAIRDDWTAKDGIKYAEEFEQSVDREYLEEIIFGLFSANEKSLEEENMVKPPPRIISIADKWVVKAKQIEIARNMKSEGTDLHFIARVTGLTFDEVLNV